MELSTSIIIAIIIFIVSSLTISFRFFFPYHRIIATILYTIGLTPLFLTAKANYLDNSRVFELFTENWILISLTIVGMYLILTLFPFKKSRFLNMPEDQALEIINRDRSLLLFLNQRLSQLLEESKNNNVLNIDFKKIERDKIEKLKTFWISFIKLLVEIDYIKSRYVTFYQINPIDKPNIHREAFKNGFFALMIEHYHSVKLNNFVTERDVETFLNQKFPVYGIKRKTFDKIRNSVTNIDEAILINANKAYSKLLKNDNDEVERITQKYLSVIDAQSLNYADLITKKPLDVIEYYNFIIWYPIQKQLGQMVGFLNIPRKYKIRKRTIDKYIDQLQPGDILINRREWRTSNFLTSGYWKHNLLYFGTIEFMNEYFDGIPELQDKTFKEYVQRRYPKIYKKLIKKTFLGRRYRVIESLKYGVVMNTIEKVSQVDAFCVLRVKNITKSEQFKVVIEAMSHFKKGYDYSFDIATDAELLCSELVVKSYLDIDKLNIEAEESLNRYIYTPSAFVQKFDEEYKTNEQELDLILFLDGKAIILPTSTENIDRFRNSWKR